MFSRRVTRAMAGTSPGGSQSEDRDGSVVSELSRVCVVGCGGLCIDYLAAVTAFPHPDDKIRSTSLEVQGGGNVGNTLTAISRLGLSTRIFTKLADDLLGKAMIAELQADGVDTSHVIVGSGGMSPSTYIIVDQQTNTRTCIHTPGAPALHPSELSAAAIASLLSGATLAYFDGRLADTTIKICQQAVALGLPVLVDAEKPRDGLDELLAHATYVVVSEKFPQAWTGEGTLGAALLAMAGRLPKARFIIVTRGAAGCAMLDRRVAAGQG
ncbi:hypothetical protein CLOM_g6432 [Closterium sp. NIES-68]|nr:hypothetical protein CLOM_g6432 [Closterium sp. NIES-68]